MSSVLRALENIRHDCANKYAILKDLDKAILECLMLLLIECRYST